MILEITIKNFVIIDNLTVTFGKGLNILTGETGAGKSILIDALSGVLGEKMTTDMIRTGHEKATLECLFDITGLPQVSDILNESGIDYDDNQLIIRRELYSSGRGRCFANSVNIPISRLKEISEYLVDIHGQNEHQNIVKVAKHRELLDSFAGTVGEVLEMRNIHARLQELKDRLKSFDIDEKEKARLIEYNRFAINEIDASRLSLNEEEALKQESVLLANSEKLFNEINGSTELMNGDGGVIQKLKKIEQSVSSVSEFDSNISSTIEQIREALYTLEDSSIFLRDYEKNINFSPKRVNEVEERLLLISSLKKKYGAAIRDILDYAEKAKKEIDAISSSEEELGKLKEEYRNAVKEAKDKALSLSAKRKNSAGVLEKMVIGELNDLGMGGTRFTVSIDRELSTGGEIETDNRTYMLYPHGLDRIEFMLSANEGEDMKELRRVASGGEMSRIMLAIKKVILSADIVDSIVFDEVDAGISGKTAETVGKKLKELARDRQVLVITHLPQIAAMGDSNYLVQKGKISDRVNVTLKLLNKKEKISEVARMLAGEKVTELSMRHAEEMVSHGESI